MEVHTRPTPEHATALTPEHATAVYLLMFSRASPGQVIFFHFSLHLPSPGLFRSSSHTFSIWCPSESSSDYCCLQHSQDVANPLPSASFYLQCDGLGLCSAVEFCNGDGVRPDYLEYFAKADFKSVVDSLCNFPGF